MKFFNKPNVIPVGTVLDTSFNSSAVPLTNVFNYSIQIVFTGTPTGAFSLQSSCDTTTPANLNESNSMNWTDITDSEFSVSAAGNVEWNVDGAAYAWVRVVYTDGSSGSSAALVTSATFNGKGF
jgi:hypothetical protein